MVRANGSARPDPSIRLVTRALGCLHPIQPGTPHVVAWPHEPSMFSRSPVEERRHWHTGCWRSRP
ncbi:MAG: hypothetical protein B6I33_06930 [Propionibacterium sp. 4572_24]|nr:MAG: hypothetical protein B6I33_06930 [Propionibacterium sp. 4572_24]